MTSWVSPVQTVPNEILEAIFDDCCDTNLFKVTGVRSMAFLRDKPALTLSSVCSRWRSVGLSLSSIWSRISLKYYDDDLPLVENRLATILTIFISRSRQQPLSINIYLDDYEFKSSAPETYQLLSMLCKEYQRWSSFTFRSESWTVHNLFNIGFTLANLDVFLNLVDLDLPPALTGTNLDFFTRRAPKLRRLNLDSDWTGYETLEIPSAFPLAQLTHLRLDITSSVVWETLQKQVLSETALLSLDTEDVDWIGRNLESITSTTCSSIELLNVRHYWNDTSGSIFPFLNLPSLKTLRLDCGQDSLKRDHWWRNFDPFMAFVKRSSFPLTTLYIECLALSDSNLVYLLHHIPTLMDLTFNDTKGVRHLSPITKQFIESLHAHRTSSLRQQTAPLIPRLRYLTLATGATSFDDEAVVDMVTSRWAPDGSDVNVDCLRSFTITFHARTKVPCAYETLNNIEKAGMRIAVLVGQV
ncbi:hypothetical protein BDP27DRAFT_1328564 [Rhodocollybia butyracea]|uniref:F-box domain-containing protein n=1 Tax=Rhodocollybia butyracea TaxID=206335 RepID=A0A9P5PQW7_9AGAR|nr:hypothetical protein BDP27DRAFT_1328564 [Rhodocollybia butyracea]